MVTLIPYLEDGDRWSWQAGPSCNLQCFPSYFKVLEREAGGSVVCKYLRIVGRVRLFSVLLRLMGIVTRQAQVYWLLTVKHWKKVLTQFR